MSRHRARHFCTWLTWLYSSSSSLLLTEPFQTPSLMPSLHSLTATMWPCDPKSRSGLESLSLLDIENTQKQIRERNRNISCCYSSLPDSCEDLVFIQMTRTVAVAEETVVSDMQINFVFLGWVMQGSWNSDKIFFIGMSINHKTVLDLWTHRKTSSQTFNFNIVFKLK